jgi:hypothetical protein
VLPFVVNGIGLGGGIAGRTAEFFSREALGASGGGFGVLEALLHVESGLDAVDFDGEGATGCAVGGETLIMKMADFFE